MVEECLLGQERDRSMDELGWKPARVSRDSPVLPIHLVCPNVQCRCNIANRMQERWVFSNYPARSASFHRNESQECTCNANDPSRNSEGARSMAYANV